MATANVPLAAFNRGRISRLALARTDIKRVALSADEMTNWMPRVLGSMMLRPGWGYLGAIPAAPRILPFIFAASDTALLEFTSSGLRVWVDFALVTRVAVSTAVTNGDFTIDLTGWTDNDEAGGTSVFVAGGYMGLTGDGTNAAIRDQAVAVSAADQAKEHGIRIVVQRGPVMCRIGTTVGGDELLNEAELGTGTHSFGITPNAATINIRFFWREKRQALVDSCNIEAAGVMSLPSPYAAADLSRLRFDQSGDIVYIGCGGANYQQRKVERRGVNSWSIVRYQTLDGPFRGLNITKKTLTPAALSGNTTLTSSVALFKSTHAPSANNDGALFRVFSNGQTVTAAITAANVFTDPIRVEGTGTARSFAVNIAGTWVATVRLQRSFASDTGPWTDVSSWVVNQTNVVITDGFDNQIAWYRIGVKTGEFTSGTVQVSLNYANGSISGVCRVTGFTSATVVDVEVIKDFGGTTASQDWEEGEWSDFRGWPGAVALYEGRLWWAGNQGIFGSVSDGYESFDEELEGDSAPINRDIGSGPLDEINWLMPLSRLVVGSEGAEHSVRSSSLDEPITPFNFNVKPDSTQGSAAVGAVKLDRKGIFVQQGGTRVFELDNADQIDYEAHDLTVLIPEICEPSVSRMALQRKPDTRIHCVLSDGTAALAVYDRTEGVLCWFDVEARSGDAIEDAAVLPGALGEGEDAVFYATRRTINGATVRHLELWALESECRGGTLNAQADAYVEFTNTPPSATVTGLTHLVGESVVVWADGKCLRTAAGAIATFTVSGGGQITLTNAGAAYAATTGIVGLAYRARWKSSKLAYAANLGTALNQIKQIKRLGCILADTHFQGLRYGPSFTTMSELPLVENAKDIAQDTVHSSYDAPTFEFEGEWGADSRLCLEANAPRPVNILAAIVGLEERGRT